MEPPATISAPEPTEPSTVTSPSMNTIDWPDRTGLSRSNEVGFGIVPDNALARRFRDAQGTLNQRLAQTCDATDLVVAGLPLRLSGEK